MFFRKEISILALLVVSGTAQAQFAKPGTIQETMAKAAASVNKAMSTGSGKPEVVFDKVFGVTPSGRILLSADNRALEIDPSLSTSNRKFMENAIRNNINKELVFELSARGFLVNIRPLSKNEEKSKYELRQEIKRLRGVNRALNTTPRAPFAPTTVSTANQLYEVFSNVDPMNQDYMDLNDNCFNRSHYFARQNEIGAFGQLDEISRKQSGVLLKPTIDVRKQPDRKSVV